MKQLRDNFMRNQLIFYQLSKMQSFEAFFAKFLVYIPSKTQVKCYEQISLVVMAFKTEYNELSDLNIKILPKSNIFNVFSNFSI